MADFADGAVVQQDFDNIKTDFYFGIFDEPQIIERGLLEKPALVRVHGGGRTYPILGRTGFYLNEHQAIVLAENKINFAARRAEIGGEEFHAQPAQMFFGRKLSQFASPQMLRLRFIGET